MNLVIPVGSASKFFPESEYYYPKSLIEIAGKPMIAHALDCLTAGQAFEKIVFIVRSDDCIKHHLDETLKLICPVPPTIIRLQNETKGALCSVLLAIEHINNDLPLVVANADQSFSINLKSVFEKFSQGHFDAGCVTFNSVHPRWSYVRVNEKNEVVEALEKQPVSRHAIAGIYWYKRGWEFVKYGMRSIQSGIASRGPFYVAPVFNEFILSGKTVGHFAVANEFYHTFYSPSKINEFEASNNGAQ